MSKQQTRIVDLSEFGGQPSQVEAPKIVDLSEFTQKKNPNINMDLSGKTNSTDGDSETSFASKPMSLSFMDAMSYNRNAPEKSDYDGLSSMLSLPKFLASGTTRMLGNAFTGIFSNIAKLTDQSKALAMQSVAAIASGSLEPLTSESNHDRWLKAIKESPSGNRDAVLNEMGTVLKNTANEISVSAKKDLGWTDEDMNKGFSDFIEEGNVSKAIGAVYAGVVENIPQQALLATLGVSNTAAFAGGTALGTAAALTEEYEKDKEISFADAASSIGKGIIEGATEMIFKTDIQMARQLGKSIFKLEKSAGLDAIKNLIKTEGADGAKQALVRDGKEILKKTIFGGAEEGLEEILSTVGDFTIDTARSGEWNDIDYKRLLKQGVDSFVIGFASGGTMSGLASTAAYKPLEQEQQKKIDKFMEIANDETLSKEVRDIAKKQAEDIEKYDADQYIASYNQLAALPIGERVKAAKIMSEIQSLEAEKKDIKDLEVIQGVDENIKEKNKQVQDIIDNHSLNLADEIVNSNEAIDGNVAFSKDSQLTVSPDTGYVFHFDSESQIPSALRDVEPISAGNVEGRDKTVFRVAYTGQDLINAGLANQAPQVGVEQLNEATANVESTANTVQEIVDNAPKALENILPNFQEQEGKTIAQQIAEQYHNAKETNTNQEFVEQVDEAIKAGLNQKTLAAQPVIAPKPKRKRNVQTLRGMKPSEGVELTTNIENDFTGVLGKMGRGTKLVLQNYVKALKSVRPEAKVFYYEDAAAMEKGLKNSGFNASKAKQLSNTSGGLFTTVNKGGEVVIHVNRQADLSKKGADAGQQSNIILAHEIVHATLLELARVNPSEFKNMRGQLLDMLAKDESANEEIKAFVERYSNQSEEVQAEEFLAQLGALITRQKATLKRSTLDKIKLAIREFLQKVASKFRSKSLMNLVESEVFAETAKAEDTARFLEGLGKSLREGTDIDMKYIKNLVKGSKEYQQGLRYSVIENAEPIPSGMDANTLLNNDMAVEPESVKQSALDEGNWTDNPENKKKMAKYISTIKGMTEDDVWLAKAIAYNENKGIKLYTLKDKESVYAALESQMADLYAKIDEELSGQFEFASEGELWGIGGYLFTGWKPEYIDSRIILFTNDYNADQLLRWNTIKSDPNYHRQEVGVIREIQKKALLANISEFNGHSEFDSAFSYMLINSMIYNKYSVAENEETGESEIKVFKYKQNQLATTDASYATLQYDVAKALYDSKNSKESAGDIGIAYQKAYMGMAKLNVVNSKFSKYIDKKSSTGEGYWLKFPQGDNPETSYDLFEIAKTSHKYPAKWCTGSSDSTAASQLRDGDFYVFVDNKTGDARIAVRYDGDKISEVRGLGEGQAILSQDSGIIEEVASTFKDGKAYESYSNTLKDIKNIASNFFTKDEFNLFAVEYTGNYSNLLNPERANEFVKYVSDNFSVDDIARILMEEDRSYGKSDYLLQNIQNEVDSSLRDIMVAMGESEYAIVKNYNTYLTDKENVKNIKYILKTLSADDNQEYNFENLVFVNEIEIEGIQTFVIANKLKSVNSIAINDGEFKSSSLQSVKNKIQIDGDYSAIEVPNLKKAYSIKANLWDSDVFDFSSLEECSKIFLNITSKNITFNLPKLKTSRTIDVLSQTVASSNFVLNLPAIENRLDRLSLKGITGSSTTMNINNGGQINVGNVIVDGDKNNLSINGLFSEIGELNAFGGTVNINTEKSIEIYTIEGTGNFNINNTSNDKGLITDINIVDLDDAYLSLTGKQLVSLDTVRIRKESKIDGNISFISSLELGNHSKTEISANTIKKAKVNRMSRLSLNNNESIEQLELLDGSFTFLDSKQIGSISGFYSSLLGKNLELVNDFLFNLEDGNNIFLPNLKKINNMLVLTGKIKEDTFDLSGLESSDSVSINQGYFNLRSLNSAKKITLREGKLDVNQLKNTSKVILGDGSDLYAPQLNSGYEIQSLYGEFDSKESSNRIFDENGGKEFKREPSDVKESKVGDIGKSSREEYERRTNKTWKQKVSEVYNKTFERNEEARQAFKKSDMTFSMYSMYLKAGATPFAMRKFTDAYFKIYDGLTEEQVRNLDSVIYLQRVIAIDTNFDNRGKKRPAHPDIELEDGKLKAVNKEVAEAELKMYEDVLGKDYVADLKERAKTYFNTFSEILKFKYDNGLISKETYDLYKDYNYSPRKFLEHIIDVNGISAQGFGRRGLNLGAEEIKNIQSGSTDNMLFDSAMLLKAALISAENRVFTNRALKFIFEEGMTRKNDIVKDANYSKLKDGTIRLDKDGSPIVKEASNGYVNKTYRDNNGKVYAFQMKSDIAQQFDDLDLENRRTWYQKVLQWGLGAPIVQNLAVTLNPFFGLVNPIIDLGTQVMFSNTYKAAGRGLLAQSFAATKEFVNITKGIIALDAVNSKGGRKFGLSESAKQGEIRQLMEEYGKYGGFMTTQNEAGASANKIGAVLSYYGNVTEVSAKLAAYKFIKDSMLKDFAKENIDPETGESIEPSEEQMRNIMISAAYGARETLDYNRGGKWAKDMSQYVPFLNVSLQVKKIGTQYVVNNPADFIRKIQGGIFITAAITFLNLIIDAEDYEKDKRIKKDKVDKTIIMLPFTMKDLGLSDSDERAYIPLPTPSFAKAFFNVGQVMAEQLYYDSVGRVNPNEGNAVSKMVENNYNMFAREIKGMFMPKTIQAAMSYFFNYDFWREEKLTKDDKLVESRQGAGNKDIMATLKWMAESIDKLTDGEGIGFGGGKSFSPEKFQKSMEVVTTSPTYNGLANTAFWMIDNIFQAAHKIILGQDVDKRIASRFTNQSFYEMIGDTFGKGFGRLVRVTDPSKYNTPDYNAQEDAREEINLMDARIATKKSTIYHELMDIYDESKEQKNPSEYLKQKATEYASNIKDPREFNYVKGLSNLLYGKTKVSLGNNVDKYYNISSEAKDTRTKAYAIWRSFGDIRNNQDLLNDLQNIGVTQQVINEYRGILIQEGLVGNGSDGKPVYEEWYKSMLKSAPKTGVTPPLSAAPVMKNSVSIDAVASTINASAKTAETVAGVFNSIGNQLNDIEKTVAGKINLISKAIESNEKFQDAKAVIKNPDLILAAIQRQFDKGDESGVVSKKIVVPKQVTPQFSLTGGKPIVASDTTNLGNLRNSNSEYLATSSITDLNKVNVGERNRGDYKEGQGNLIASFLQPFTKPKDLSNDKMYVGIKDGKLVTGNGAKVKDAQSVTQTPFAQVVEISDELVKNQSYLFPKLKTLKSGQEDKLNISTTASGKGDANNRFAGGATIIETPDGSQKYLVRGSLDQVKSAFNDLKKNTNSPYLNMYILDNGSYSTGLFTKDGKSSTEELKSYESKNVNGGHGIYLK